MERDPPIFQTRPFFYMVCIGVLVAWALVGIATGHAYLQYWRAPPADFDGWAAIAFSTALLFAATGMSERLVNGGAGKGEWKTSSYLFLASTLMAGGAIACELMPRLLGFSASTPYTGLVTEEALWQALNAPFVASWAAGKLPVVFSWLKSSCVVLIVLALVFKGLGVSKESAQKHPAVASGFYFAFGLPFLAWVSLELVQYIFGTLPTVPMKALDSFQSRASLMLSALLVIIGIWSFALLAGMALILKKFGVSVQWQKIRGREKILDDF